MLQISKTQNSKISADPNFFIYSQNISGFSKLNYNVLYHHKLTTFSLFIELFGGYSKIYSHMVSLLWSVGEALAFLLESKLASDI